MRLWLVRMNTRSEWHDVLLPSSGVGGGGGGVVLLHSSWPEPLRRPIAFHLQRDNTEWISGPAGLIQVLFLTPAAGEVRAQRRTGKGEYLKPQHQWITHVSAARHKSLIQCCQAESCCAVEMCIVCEIAHPLSSARRWPASTPSWIRSGMRCPWITTLITLDSTPGVMPCRRWVLCYHLNTQRRKKKIKRII